MSVFILCNVNSGFLFIVCCIKNILIVWEDIEMWKKNMSSTRTKLDFVDHQHQDHFSSSYCETDPEE